MGVGQCCNGNFGRVGSDEHVEAANISPSCSICNNLLKAHYALAHIHRLLGNQKVNLWTVALLSPICISQLCMRHSYYSKTHNHELFLFIFLVCSLFVGY